MKRLNHVGSIAKGAVFFCFFVGGRYDASARNLGTARAHAPGTVAVSPAGRQWVSVGDDGQGGATGWRFVSPYMDIHEAVRDPGPVQLKTTRKAEKLRLQIEDYLNYFISVKGRKPPKVVLRTEQLAELGALAGQTFRSVPLEAYS